MAQLGLKLEEGADADDATKVGVAPREVVEQLKTRRRKKRKKGKTVSFHLTPERQNTQRAKKTEKRIKPVA